ncbi:MAG: hypothetical protein KY428_05880 [Bacteroidetes bacterium]|nr:hypothetical protein [Bacteroidota bacterium]
MIEREYKFLLKEGSEGDIRKYSVLSGTVNQSYLLSNKESEVRFRVSGNRGFVTVKEGNGFERNETEYEIDYSIAFTMIQTLRTGVSSNYISKRRYVYEAEDGLTWEIDCFSGNNSGLCIAELEVPNKKHGIRIPHWMSKLVVKEVTGDLAYSNKNLAFNKE